MPARTRRSAWPGEELPLAKSAGIAVLLMLVGIGLIGTLTATVASFFVHEHQPLLDLDRNCGVVECTVTELTSVVVSPAVDPTRSQQRAVSTVLTREANDAIERARATLTYDLDRTRRVVRRPVAELARAALSPAIDLTRSQPHAIAVDVTGETVGAAERARETDTFYLYTPMGRTDTLNRYPSKYRGDLRVCPPDSSWWIAPATSTLAVQHQPLSKSRREVHSWTGAEGAGSGIPTLGIDPARKGSQGRLRPIGMFEHVYHEYRE
jgi:hypothetical protein